MTKRTLADLLRDEARALQNRAGGICYLSYPYPCCLTESTMHAAKFRYPPASRLTVDRREARATTITIKPRPGSGLRLPHKIRLWV